MRKKAIVRDDLRQVGCSEIKALLVGIDAYVPSEIPRSAPEYYPLYGAVNDVRRVERFLLSRLKVPQANIVHLTATNTIERDGPQEPLELQPTAANLARAFEMLIEQAQPKQQILIYYAGHGGQAKTSSEAKRIGGVDNDECFAPVDINLSDDVAYLRDHELAECVKRMMKAGAFVTLVMDCCHSGGLTRAPQSGETIRVRGHRQIDLSPRPPQLLSFQNSSLRLAERSSRLPGLFESKGYVMLAACRPSENALETRMENGITSGVLTHCLLHCLEQTGTTFTLRQAYNRLVGQIHGRFPMQTPYLEGETGRPFLGRSALPALEAFNVFRGEAELGEEKIELQAGAITGIGAGAIFSIYPQRSLDIEEEFRLALAKVVEVQAERSTALILERYCQESRVSTGDQAVLLELGIAQLRRPVRFAFRVAEPTESERRAQKQLERALLKVGSGFLEWFEEGDNPEGFEVQITETGRFVICDGSGIPLPHLQCPSLHQRNAEVQIVESLIHLAKFRNIFQIGSVAAHSPLENALDVSVRRIPLSFGGTDYQQLPLLGMDGEASRVQIGESICFRLVNRSRQALNVAALDLQPDWGISQLHPASAFQTLDPGEAVQRIFVADLPEGMEQGTDTLKVFAGFGPLNLHCLLLPPIGEHQKHCSKRGIPGGSSLNQLLESMALYEPKARNFTASSRTGEGWTTGQVEVKVVR